MLEVDPEGRGLQDRSGGDRKLNSRHYHHRTAAVLIALEVSSFWARSGPGHVPPTALSRWATSPLAGDRERPGIHRAM